MKSRKGIKKYHLHKENPYKRQFEVYDLAEYFAKNQKHSIKPHSHSYYQVIWFFKGGGSHFVDFKPFPIKKNALFFIAKNQVHHFEERKGYQGVLMHFNETFIYQNEEDIDIFLQYNVFNNIHQPFIQIRAAFQKELKNFIEIIQLELSNENTFGHKSILSNTLKSFLIRIEREKRLTLKETSFSGNDLRFVQFRKLLEKQYKQNKSVLDYASKLNVSTKTLNKIVKNSTGKTTSEIIQDRIIIEAKRQLIYSPMQVNEIAFDLGFDDPSYFIKFFKKKVKTTPTLFKNSYS